MTLKLNEEQQKLKLIQVNGGFEVQKRVRTWKNGRVDWKIIFATPNLNLEGVPLIEENIPDIPKYVSPTNEPLLAQELIAYSRGWAVGYEQAQQDSFTEEEAIGFYLWARKKYGSVKPIEEGCIVAKTDYSGLFQLYIQETKQPKVEIIFENNTPIKCIML